MKKRYQKPEIVIEEFQVADVIASCHKNIHSQKGGCNLKYPGMGGKTLFYPGSCSVMYTEQKNNSNCYDIPQPQSAYFGS